MNKQLYYTIINALILITLTTTQAKAQDEEYYTDDYLRYDNYTYDPKIHSLVIHKSGFELSMPLITLDSDETITLSFDDFRDEALEYSYEFIHCTANWQPSNLNFLEFADGFEQNYIEDFSFSFNTLQEFVHYNVEFPNNNIQLKISGNYLIRVFDSNTPEKTILTARFMIVEPRVKIYAKVKQASVPSKALTSEEVDFEINTEKYKIDDAHRSLKVMVLQNDRFDNAIFNLNPREIRNNILDFDYDDVNIFDAGNEFRPLNLKSLRYQTSRMARMDLRKFENHIYMLPEVTRSKKPYTFYEDINGRKLIKTEDYKNSDIEADYVYVHITLPFKAPLANGNLYIMGGLTNWQFLKDYQLHYNYQEKVYEATIYVKQGFYDYQIVFLENGKTKGDLSLIEGNHYQTVNEYTILAYYKKPGDNYDRLIGAERIDSNKKQ